MDLFDYKPTMKDWYDKDLPESIRQGQRLTTMTSGQTRFPIAPSKFKFAPAGECGLWMNRGLLPHLSKKADEICWMRSLHTEAINHEPAIAAMQTGNQITGRPCLGSWASYGLGTMNADLPAFVVLVAIPSNREQEQAISSRLWSSGYLSGEHAGVSFRSSGDPILYINNPPGVPTAIRQRTIEGLNELNELNYAAPERPRNAHSHSAIRVGLSHASQRARIDRHQQRNRAYVRTLRPRCQEARHLCQHRLDGRDAWSNAACGLYRSITITGITTAMSVDVCPISAGTSINRARVCWRILKQRGMLDDTLVIWGGEFGRTIYSQGGLSKENYGRDHHPRCFSMWMAGGGAKGVDDLR